MARWAFWATVSLLSVSSFAQECLPTIPYGYFSKYLSLPRTSSFCVQKGLKSVPYKTDSHGGRVLGVGQSRTNIFGESQALVIDSQVLPSLYRKLGIEKAHIYATPNNGPYEWLRRLVQGNYEPAEDHLYVVNLGFDIFRLGPDWSVKDLAGTELATVERFIGWPRLLSLNLMWGQYKLRRLTLTGDDRADKLKRFLDDSHGYEKKLLSWATLAGPILDGKTPQSKSQLLVITPYWLDPSKQAEDRIAKQLLQTVTCGLGEKIPVLGVSFVYDGPNVTEDGRHFRHTAQPVFTQAEPCGN